MASLAVKLPITRDSGDGFTMIKDFRTLIKQNFKMLLLTNRGERVMEPSFGIGLHSYLPVIKIKEINFIVEDIDINKLSVSIEYSIPTLNVGDLLEFTI